MSINNWVLSYQAWKENRSIRNTKIFKRRWFGLHVHYSRYNLLLSANSAFHFLKNYIFHTFPVFIVKYLLILSQHNHPSKQESNIDVRAQLFESQLT